MHLKTSSRVGAGGVYVLDRRTARCGVRGIYAVVEVLNAGRNAECVGVHSRGGHDRHPGRDATLPKALLL